LKWIGGCPSDRRLAEGLIGIGGLSDAGSIGQGQGTTQGISMIKFVRSTLSDKWFIDAQAA
jgi:hypothetical protein